MEELKNYPLISHPPNILYEVRKMYNLEKPGRMKEAIDILEEWIKKQEHFESKNFDRNYLEILILNCKGSLEKAKMKIDKLCTMRTLAPEFFVAELMELKLNRTRWHYATMPMLTPDYKRIFVTKALGLELNPDDYLNIFRDYIICSEFLLHTSYSVGYIAIKDFRDVNMTNLLSTLNFTVASKYVTILQEGYGMRTAALHFLSNSSLIENFVGFLKPLLPEKITKRIHVHTSLETLHKMVPKELLPKDLGGDEPPIAEMHAARIKEHINTKEHIEYMKEVLKQKTDESKRIGGEIDYEFLQGTFRSLNVD